MRPLPALSLPLLALLLGSSCLAAESQTDQKPAAKTNAAMGKKATIDPKMRQSGSLVQGAPGRTNGKGKDDAGAAPATSMMLSVKGVTDGRPIRGKYAYCIGNRKNGTVPGQNINPGVTWSGLPANAKSLALIVVDKDVPASFESANVEGKTIPADFPRRDFYHWVLIDIPTTINGLGEGRDSNGITAGGGKPFGPTGYGINGQNDYRLISEGPHGGYDGPCPPWNDERKHNYHFQLFALDVPSLGLPNPVNGEQVEAAIKGHIVGQAEVVGVYTTYAGWQKKMVEGRRAARAAQSKNPGIKTASTQKPVIKKTAKATAKPSSMKP